MPIIEMARWIGSDALLKDGSVIQPFFEVLAHVDGLKKKYWGIGEEDNTIRFAFVLWESFNHHKALLATAEYPQIIAKLLPAVKEGGGIRMHHVEFNDDFMPAVTSPTTEIISMTLKEGKLKDDLNDVASRYARMINERNPRFAPVIWGESAEDTNQFYLVCGWESLQAHFDCIEEVSIQSMLAELGSVVELDRAHANFKHVA